MESLGLDSSYFMDRLREAETEAGAGAKLVRVWIGGAAYHYVCSAEEEPAEVIPIFRVRKNNRAEVIYMNEAGLFLPPWLPLEEPSGSWRDFEKRSL